MVNRIRPELHFDVPSDLVEVDAEGCEQGGRVEAGTVAASGADDEPDGVTGSLGRDIVLGQKPGGRACLRLGQGEQQVFQTDVAVAGQCGFGAGGGEDRADRREDSGPGGRLRRLIAYAVRAGGGSRISCAPTAG